MNAKYLLFRFATAELQARLTIAETIYVGAHALQKLAHRVSGGPYVEIDEPAEVGATTIMLSAGVPPFVRGLKLELASGAAEVRRIKAIRGASVELDCPIAQAYPRGARVKVCV